MPEHSPRPDRLDARSAPPGAGGRARRRSLERTLPLLVAALLAATLAVTLALTYATLTRAARGAATERLERAADQLGGLASGAMGRLAARLAESARDSALRSAAAAPAGAEGTGTVAAARAALRGLLSAADTGLAVELWAEDGRRVAFAGRDLRADAAPAREGGGPLRATPGFEALAAADSVQVGALYTERGVPHFWVVAPVVDGGARVGHLARQYRIAEGPRADETLRALTGGDVTAYYRNADGRVWTTLSGAPASAPVRRGGAGGGRPAVRRPGVGELLAAERPIRGTPLRLVLELPERSVLAAPHAAVARLALWSLAVLVAGAVAAWLLGRRVTRPLVALTGAAGAVARGDYDARVRPDGHEELARLAESFNHMAHAVGVAHVELETQTEEAQAIAEELEQTNAELAEALREVEEREAHVRALADAIPQLAWMADADGAVVWCNARWYAYTGMTPARTTGWGWQAAHDPAVLPAVVERWRASIATGAPFEMTFPLRGADGTFRWFLTRVQPVRDREGRVARWFGSSTDVQALRDAQAAAEAANRAKGEFLAVMSHELRTPLNAIGGYTELLELGIRGPVTEQQREDLVRIRRNQQHLLTIITDILNHARLDAGRVQFDVRAVRLAELLPSLGALVGPQMRARALDFRLDGCDGRLAVLADAEKLRQVLLNLLTNAAKFTPRGGRVAVECAPRGRGVDIRVTDTGIGIPADKLQAIFEPFVQLDATFTREAGGTGLGLAISRAMARGMGGEIRVESAVGAGSTFTLTLPRTDDAVRPAADLAGLPA